jgi:hypothetical protein
MAKKNKPQNNLILTVFIAVAGLVYFSFLSGKHPSDSIPTDTLSKMENEEPNFDTKSNRKQTVINEQSQEQSEVAGSRALQQDSQAPTVALRNTTSIPTESGVRIERLKVDPNTLPADLPDDLREQILNPPIDIPPELEAQVNAPRGELPDDIRKALSQPARQIPAEEVNLTPDELLEP